MNHYTNSVEVSSGDGSIGRSARYRKSASLLLMVIGCIIVYLLPAWLGGSTVVYGLFVTIAILSVMALGVDVVLSYLGEVSLGHTIFWAIGGYAAAILSTTWDVNGWTTAAAAIALSVLAATMLGLATLRTREFVFSLATYAAAVVVAEITFNTDALGGSDGIVGIPPLHLPFGIADFTGRSSADLWPIAFALLLLSLGFVARFRRSRLGMQALMVQMNAPLATSSGLDAHRVRFLVFVVSAPITALAGWLYAYQRAYVGPDMFDMYFLTMMLTSIILVGTRILLASTIGVTLLLIQQNYLSIGGDGNKVVLGTVLVLMLVLWPKGLVRLIVDAIKPAVRRRQTVELNNGEVSLRKESARSR
ncbi:MAG: branched-chain amino acid ABC transporter permease [Xanthobacteraceae bacterium]